MLEYWVMRANKACVAALFAILSVLAAVNLALKNSRPDLGEKILVVGVCLTLFALGLISWVGARRSGHDACARERERLRGQGLLRRDEYRVTRAFRLAERLVEGPHYFLELADGRVLYLCGQYLYEEDASAIFPTGTFAVERHAVLGSVFDVLCEGARVPLAADLPASDRLEADGWQDGEVRAVSFDALLAEYKNAAGS